MPYLYNYIVEMEKKGIRRNQSLTQQPVRRVGTDLGQGNRRGRSPAPLDPAMSWASRDISPELGRCCVCSCAFLSPSDTNNSKVRFDGGTQPPWTGGGPRRGADPDSLSGRMAPLPTRVSAGQDAGGPVPSYDSPVSKNFLDLQGEENE